MYVQGRSPYTMTSHGTTITFTLIVLFYTVDIIIVIAIDITTLGNAFSSLNFLLILCFIQSPPPQTRTDSNLSLTSLIYWKKTVYWSEDRMSKLLAGIKHISIEKQIRPIRERLICWFSFVCLCILVEQLRMVHIMLLMPAQHHEHRDNAGIESIFILVLHRQCQPVSNQSDC